MSLIVELAGLGSSFHHLGWEASRRYSPTCVKPEGLPSGCRVSSDAASDAGEIWRCRWGGISDLRLSKQS